MSGRYGVAVTVFLVQIFARSGGRATLVNIRSVEKGCTWTYEEGSGGTVEGATGPLGMTVHSAASVSISYNDFSEARIFASGDPDATIPMEYNWWGSTDPAEIESKIQHHVDNAGYPWVDYDPWLRGPPARHDLVGDCIADAYDAGPLGSEGFMLRSQIGDGAYGDQDVDLFRFEVVSTARWS